MEKRIFVVYCSPSGSTRHVAEVMRQELSSLHAEVHPLDLGKERHWSSVLDRFNTSREEACLFIGSPVYRNLAVPLVMQFIEALPNVQGCSAVPFVTWGGAASGIALWQIGQALVNKGFVIAGAAKVLGVHSLMWNTDHPLGQGHPDGKDDSAVKDLVRTISKKLESGDLQPLPLDMLDYQPEEQAKEMKKMLGAPPSVTPRTVDEAKCTQCEICVHECPAGAITLAPFPQFSTRCIDCFNCIRLCPENAIEPKVALQKIEGLIRKRSETMNEHPPTQIFV